MVQYDVEAVRRALVESKRKLQDNFVVLKVEVSVTIQGATDAAVEAGMAVPFLN